MVSLLVAKAMGAAQVVVTGKALFSFSLLDRETAGPTVCVCVRRGYL